MGFHEDDRIRRKNAAHNTAAEVYSGLENLGLSPTEIVERCETIIAAGGSEFIRNDTLSMVIQIARRNVSENKG